MILLHCLSDLNKRKHMHSRREEYVRVTVNTAYSTHDGWIFELKDLKVTSEWAKTMANVIWVGVTS